jgi:hypothetical protein
MKSRVTVRTRLALMAAAVAAVAVLTPSAAPQNPVVVFTLEPRTGTNPVGTAHTVIGRTRDLLGNEVTGIPAFIEVLGASEVSSTDCVTPCVFTYIGPQEPGADLIRGFVDFDLDRQQDAGESGDAVSKAWFDPAAPETGSATGAGHALDPVLGEFAFGFRATTQGGPAGHCRIANRNNGDLIRCLTVDLVAVIGTHVTFSGMAEVNGSMEAYTIDADDLDPGTDLFSFDSTTRDYNGPLTNGNINVRPTG